MPISSFNDLSQSMQLNINQLNDKILLRCFSYLTHAQHLTCMKVCKKWHHLIQDTRLWTYLNLRGIPQNNNDDIDIRKEQLLYDQTLTIRNVDLFLKVLSKKLCHTLTDIELSCELITANVLHVLANRCPYLKHMTLDFSTAMQLHDFNDLNSFPCNLKNLTICLSEVIFLEGFMRCVYTSLSSIEILTLIGTTDYSIYDEEPYETINIIKIKQHTPNLTILNLFGVGFIDDAHIEAVASGCIHLEVVAVHYCHKLKGYSFVTLLNRCKKMRTLLLRNTGIEDNAFNSIDWENANNIRELDICSTELSESCIENIVRKLPHGFTYLNVAYCDGFTDKVLSLLGERSKMLKALNLSHTIHTSGDAIKRFISIHGKQLKGFCYAGNPKLTEQFWNSTICYLKNVEVLIVGTAYGNYRQISARVHIDQIIEAVALSCPSLRRFEVQWDTETLRFNNKSSKFIDHLRLRCSRLRSFTICDGEYYELVKSNFERANRFRIVRTLTTYRTSMAIENEKISKLDAFESFLPSYLDYSNEAENLETVKDNYEAYLSYARRHKGISVFIVKEGEPLIFDISKTFRDRTAVKFDTWQDAWIFADRIFLTSMSLSNTSELMYWTANGISSHTVSSIWRTSETNQVWIEFFKEVRSENAGRYESPSPFWRERLRVIEVIVLVDPPDLDIVGISKRIFIDVNKSRLEKKKFIKNSGFGRLTCKARIAISSYLYNTSFTKIKDLLTIESALTVDTSSVKRRQAESSIFSSSIAYIMQPQYATFPQKEHTSKEVNHYLDRFIALWNIYGGGLQSTVNDDYLKYIYADVNRSQGGIFNTFDNDRNFIFIVDLFSIIERRFSYIDHSHQFRCLIGDMFSLKVFKKLFRFNVDIFFNEPDNWPFRYKFIHQKIYGDNSGLPIAKYLYSVDILKSTGLVTNFSAYSYYLKKHKFTDSKSVQILFGDDLTSDVLNLFTYPKGKLFKQSFQLKEIVDVIDHIYGHGKYMDKSDLTLTPYYDSLRINVHFAPVVVPCSRRHITYIKTIDENENIRDYYLNVPCKIVGNPIPIYNFYYVKGNTGGFINITRYCEKLLAESWWQEGMIPICKLKLIDFVHIGEIFRESDNPPLYNLHTNDYDVEKLTKPIILRFKCTAYNNYSNVVDTDLEDTLYPSDEMHEREPIEEEKEYQMIKMSIIYRKNTDNTCREESYAVAISMFGSLVAGLLFIEIIYSCMVMLYFRLIRKASQPAKYLKAEADALLRTINIK
ncbi:hypothetical protein SNEBB_002318 [Seison nebaliae]|nr:hypothetical protein SNEBB_002318 [Seison nebaliae]